MPKYLFIGGPWNGQIKLTQNQSTYVAMTSDFPGFYINEHEDPLNTDMELTFHTYQLQEIPFPGWPARRVYKHKDTSMEAAYQYLTNLLSKLYDTYIEVNGD
jgi:hypothetical protein